MSAPLDEPPPDVFAHGKVILLGEHAVVHGHLALAVALDRGVRARARRADAARLAIQPWGVRVGPDPDAPDPLARAFAAVLAQVGGPTGAAVEVEADVGLPGGAGLGCSAALGVAVLHAVERALGREGTAAERATGSLVWERVFHGNPSGVDNAVAALGGALAFRRGAPPSPVRPGAPLHLVVAHSGVASSTKAMVEGVAARLAADPAAVGGRLARLGSLADEGRRALEAGDGRALGRCLDAAHEELAGVGVSTPTLDGLVAAARAAGAWGAKLTGAGGGGCVIALVADAEAAEATRRALREAGAVEAFATRVGA